MSAENPAAYIRWTDAGGITHLLFFDVVTSIDFEKLSVPTEHEVEEGSDVSDHVSKKNPKGTLEVFVSNTPIYDVNNLGGSFENISFAYSRYVPPTIPLTPGQVIQDVHTENVFTFPDAINLVAAVEEVLEDLMESVQFVEVVTHSKTHKDMIITGVKKHEDEGTGDGANFTLSFDRIRTVEVKIVNAPKPTEKRAEKKIPLGSQAGKPAEPEKKKSLAKALLGDLINKK